MLEPDLERIILIKENKNQIALKKYTESKKAAWNEVMPLHQKAAKERWDNYFMQPGFVCLDENERGHLTRIGIKGRSVAHLCCNNGIELLSIKNLGAGDCFGFDISNKPTLEYR